MPAILSLPELRPFRFRFGTNDRTLRRAVGKVRVVIVALEYRYTCETKRLATRRDAKSVVRIAMHAGVDPDHITVLTDKDDPQQGTQRNIIQKMCSVAEQCEENEWFVWYFAGHGFNSCNPETPNAPHSFGTTNIRGKILERSLLPGLDFAKSLDDSLKPGVQILSICDCCHAEGMTGINKYEWKHAIYQFSAALAHEEAGEHRNGHLPHQGGGILANALRRAVRLLSIEYGSEAYSIQEVWDVCKIFADRMIKLHSIRCGVHQVAMEWHKKSSTDGSANPDPSQVAWPFSFPWWKYLEEPCLIPHNSLLRCICPVSFLDVSLRRTPVTPQVSDHDNNEWQLTISPTQDCQQSPSRNRLRRIDAPTAEAVAAAAAAQESKHCGNESICRRATWLREEGLPDNEGDDVTIGQLGIETLDQMKRACEAVDDCIGFAFWPSQRKWYPKKVGSGFNAAPEVYSQKHTGEEWEWHYIAERTENMWIKKDGLPENEGDDAAMEDTGIKTLPVIKAACECNDECVGFAYLPEQGKWYPKRVLSGFNAATETYSQKHKGEKWEWHYITQRAALSHRAR